MNWLTRYSPFARSFSAGAGIYTGNTPLVLTTGSFPIILTGLVVGVNCFDSVTSQFINGGFYVDIGIDPKRDNPGLQNPTLSSDTYYSTLAHGINEGLYKTMSPVEPFTVNTFFFLESVTANIISCWTSVRFRYMCPEDYLSVEGLTAATP